jgi:hypothetical protein
VRCDSEVADRFRLPVLSDDVGHIIPAFDVDPLMELAFEAHRIKNNLSSQPHQHVFERLAVH